MMPKHKALLFNFISFAVIFIAVRLLLPFFVEEKDGVLPVIVSAFSATILSPKFFVMKIDGKPRVMMKIIFVKQPKQVG